MNFKKIMAAFGVATMLFTVGGCTNALDLKLNVKSGDKYNIHVLNDQQSTVTANNQEIKSNNLMDMNLAMDVKDVDKDKNVTIAYKYDSLKISTESAGQKMEYDSKKTDSSNPLSSLYGAIVGKGFTVKISDKGQVLEVKGVDELLKSMVDKIPGTDAQKNAIKSSLQESFGEDAIKSMIDQTMNYYPKNTIKTGDTWENKYDIKVMFPMTVNNKWKLLGEKDGLLNVDVQSTISADTKDKPVDMMGVKAKIKLNGDCKGTININKDNGIMQSGNLTQTMSGEMEILANAQIPKSIKMPMKTTSKMTYETTKK